MLTSITIDEYVNSFGVRVHEAYNGYALNESHESKLEALKALEFWVSSEIQKEFQKRQQAAGMAI